jgi:hypothetical protein
MDDATKRWIVNVVRHQPTTFVDGQEFIAWAKAAVGYVVRGRRLPIALEDIEEIADDYMMRLLDERFRPHWATKRDEDIERLVVDDLCGKPGRDNNWLDKQLARRLKSREAQLPVTKGGLARPEPNAVRQYRASPDAVLRGDSFNELPSGSDVEAALLTFKCCLAEFRSGEWPVQWSAERRYAAHVLLWYLRIRPKYDDLKDYQLAAVLGCSAKVASTTLAAAQAVWIPYEELPADGVPLFTALTYEIRLTELLRSA